MYDIIFLLHYFSFPNNSVLSSGFYSFRYIMPYIAFFATCGESFKTKITPWLKLGDRIVIWSYMSS